MSTPRLAQIWSLDMSPTGEAPRVPNYDIWVVNHILLSRVAVNSLASELDAIPLSETRLRDEGVRPFYSFARNVNNILKSSARERGLAVPDIPDAPEDWTEEVSTDYKALAAQFRPHLTESARVAMDWTFGLRDRDPKPHWASVAALDSLSLDQFFEMTAGGTVGGSEWGPFVAQMTSDEIKGISKVVSEEILRIRAQPGSGWDEEEAKRLVKEQLENIKGMMAIGT